MRLLLLAYWLFFMPLIGNAQHVIKGRVLGKYDKLPLPHAAVTVTGTNHGVPTDANGEFILETENKDITLTIKFLGYLTKVIKPSFDKVNLIRLKPDCSGPHTPGPNLKLFGSWDVTNNQPGAKLQLQFPYWISRLDTDHLYQYFENGQFIYKSNLRVKNLIYNCHLRLHLQYAYENYKLTGKGFDFKANVPAVQLDLNKTRLTAGVGWGKLSTSEGARTIAGFRVGFQRWSLFNTGRVDLGWKFSATKWENFWDLELAIAEDFKNLSLELSINHIDNFLQSNLRLGWYIRLRRLPLDEKKWRKQRREDRKNIKQELKDL